MHHAHEARNKIIDALSQIDYLEEALAFSWPLDREDMTRICSLAKRYVREAHAALVTHEIGIKPATPAEEETHA